MPDTASVKISRDAKMILDNLTSKLRAAGIKITEQKIMDVLIEHSDLDSIKENLRKKDNCPDLFLYILRLNPEYDHY